MKLSKSYEDVIIMLKGEIKPMENETKQRKN